VSSYHFKREKIKKCFVQHGKFCFFYNRFEKLASVFPSRSGDKTLRAAVCRGGSIFGWYRSSLDQPDPVVRPNFISWALRCRSASAVLKPIKSFLISAAIEKAFNQKSPRREKIPVKQAAAWIIKNHYPGSILSAPFVAEFFGAGKWLALSFWNRRTAKIRFRMSSVRLTPEIVYCSSDSGSKTFWSSTPKVIFGVGFAHNLKVRVPAVFWR
jgi:hypothetical protein